MTMPSTPLRANHTLTGAIVPLPYTWRVDNKADLLVTLVDTSVTPNVETQLTVDTHYTVSGVGSDAGGNVTPLSAYTAGWRIVITNNVAYDQSTDFTNQNSVFPQVAELMADNLSKQIKQIVEILSRCIKTTVGSVTSPDSLIADLLSYVGLAQTAATTATTQAGIATTKASEASLSAAQAAASAAGMKLKSPARAATTAALPSCTYANGTAGVGATLTATANGALAAQDGVTLIAGEALLVKNQAAPAQNGIYTVTQVGTAGTPFILTRAVDSDTWAEIFSALVIVSEGSTLADIEFLCTSNNGGTMGTTAITWSQRNTVIADGSVSTAAKIADGIITYIKLAAAGIATIAELRAGTASKLVNAAILKVFRDDIANSWIRLEGSNGAGSTNTAIRRFTTSTLGTYTTDLTYADTAADGASITINTTGLYMLSYTDSFATAGVFGISKNSNQLTTAIVSITRAHYLCSTTTGATSYLGTISIPVKLQAGDVIRPHLDAVSTNGTWATSAQFTVQRVG